jgi:hypothetical protein
MVWTFEFCRRQIARVALAATLLAVGCHRPTKPAPPVLPVPTSLVSTDHFLGNALSGPIAGPVAGPVPADDPATALEVHVTMIALEKVPAANFTPLGTRASFVSATGGRNAVLAAEELTRNIQVLDPKDPTDFPAILRSAGAGQLRQIAAFPGALAPGVTADFAASDPDTVLDPVTAAPVHLKLEVLVIRPTDASQSPRVALVVTDRTSTNPPELRTEKAIFDLDSPARSTIGFVVPFHFDHAASQAVGILVSLSPGSTDPAHVAMTSKAIQQISAHLGGTIPAVSSGQAAQDTTLSAAVEGLKSPVNRRSSLAFLSNQTGATLAEDLSLEADDATLAQLVRIANLPGDPQPAPMIGWQLDHAALTLLAKTLDASNNGTTSAKMPEELAAILSNHTGEVGRHPSSLNDVLLGATGRLDLDNRLIAENTIFLEDSSPSARVRAFDWLKSHGRAPVGFDPLASGKVRQKQLEQAFNPPTTAPTTAP